MSNITELTNYRGQEEFIHNNNYAIIFFGSKSCGHCKVAEKFIIDLANEYPEIAFAHVEVSKVKTTGITGVPVFVFYVQTIPIDVVAGADSQAIVNVIENQML